MRSKQRRSKSTEPSSAYGGAYEGYQSLALYCEVKLQEALNASAERNDLRAVGTCFDLLKRMCQEGGALSTPLNAIADALRNAVYSEEAIAGPVGGGLERVQRKPFFKRVVELEAEIERVRRNAVVLRGGHQASKASKQEQEDGEKAAARGTQNTQMTESRLMHLETEMKHLIGRLESGEETARALRQHVSSKDAKLKQATTELGSVKFELDGCRRSLAHAEQAEATASAELAARKFQEAELGTNARPSLCEMPYISYTVCILQGGGPNQACPRRVRAQRYAYLRTDTPAVQKNRADSALGSS